MNNIIIYESHGLEVQVPQEWDTITIYLLSAEWWEEYKFKDWHNVHKSTSFW